jgi:hypothetical protein
MIPEPANLFIALAAAQWLVLFLAIRSFRSRSRWAVGWFLIFAAIGLAKSSWRFLSGNSDITYFALGVIVSLGVGLGAAYVSWLRTRRESEPSTTPNDGPSASGGNSIGRDGPRLGS